jgi:hypothetical protein
MKREHFDMAGGSIYRYNVGREELMGAVTTNQIVPTRPTCIPLISGCGQDAFSAK